jgi:hypothetical protein
MADLRALIAGGEYRLKAQVVDLDIVGGSAAILEVKTTRVPDSPS